MTVAVTESQGLMHSISEVQKVLNEIWPDATHHFTPAACCNLATALETMSNYWARQKAERKGGPKKNPPVLSAGKKFLRELRKEIAEAKDRFISTPEDSITEKMIEQSHRHIAEMEEAQRAVEAVLRRHKPHREDPTFLFQAELEELCNRIGIAGPKRKYVQANTKLLALAGMNYSSATVREYLLGRYRRPRSGGRKIPQNAPTCGRKTT